MIRNNINLKEYEEIIKVIKLYRELNKQQKNEVQRISLNLRISV